MVRTFQPPVQHRVKTQLPSKYRNFDHQRGSLATALGVFSVGLGLMELLRAPKVGARTGIPHKNLLRFSGLREIASGVGILTARNPAPWLWARVAGDVMDLATLGASYAECGEAGQRRACQAAVAVAAVTVLDIACASAHG